MRDEIVKALQKASGIDEVDLGVSENPEYGDYSSNIAMQRTENRNPKTDDRLPKPDNRRLAEKIVEKLKNDKELTNIVDKIEAAGPGFINFWLTGTVLVSELDGIIKDGSKYGGSNVGKGKRVLVEYSSPNIAKRFGIGHLRSTIIGQALYNLHKALGYDVIGENHLGDWGTQFGVVLRQISNFKLQISNLNVDDLEKLYVQFNKEAEDKPELWEEAKEWFKKLEEGDSEAREIWEKVREISLKEFERVYARLNVKIDHAHGESYYVDKMSSVVKEFRDKNLSTKSRGAEIVELPPANPGQVLPPAMLIKNDGATTYFTRDLTALKFRLENWNPEAIIYEVGSDQILHFKQVFAAAKIIGWKKNQKLIHIAHGLIKFKEGKMSTRKGITVRLEDVLDEAIGRAKKTIDASKTGRGLSDKQKVEVAKAVGIGAVKYFDLKHHPTSDIIFDWNKILVLEGNSGPYLQYTAARASSVLRKAKLPISNYQFPINSQISDLKISNEENLILRALIHFPEVVESAAENYSPNLLCSYLFDLAQKYNGFYNKHRIRGSENLELKLRLGLTSAVGQVLKNGLTLLGIGTPERM